MKFIHAADIHLDSPLVGLSAYQDAPSELLRHATRQAFENLVDAALQEQVDFMVIAGDLYDGKWKDFNTGLFFVGQMGRLRTAGIPVYLLFGNHDADSEMTKKLTLPDNVHVFPSNKAHTFELPRLQVALHGRSFKEPATVENLVLGYPAAKPGWLNIGVLHTALEGNTPHANYAPCSITDLQARGYQYWALGHVHAHRVEKMVGCTIAFPGNLQGRHVRETGPRGALMVQAEGTDIGPVDRLLVDVLRWHALDVDVSAAVTFEEALRATSQALEALARAREDERPMAVRVTLCGASPAHGHLFGLDAQLRAEVLALAAGLGSDALWIEKVRVTTTPHEAPTQVAARSDAIADLQLVLAGAEHDAEFMEGLRADLQQMAGRLPIELLDLVPELEGIRGGAVSALVQRTAPSLVAHLAKGS